MVVIYFGTSQVAAVLRVTPRRVRALKDRIGYVMIGGRLMFRPADVARFAKTRGK